MQVMDVNTAFYDAMFGTQDGGMNPLEEQALQNVRGILNDPAKLSSHIPPLPALLMQLLDVLNDPNADFGKITQIIEADPHLSMDILRVANSPLYNTSGIQIQNLQAAVGRLGVQGVSSIASSIMMEKIRPPKPIYYKMFGRDIWVHSLHCAFLCRAFAKEVGEDEFAGHFLGLIHDVGKIIIFNCLTDALSAGIIDGKPGSKVFKEIMSEMSLDISPFVCREWELPEKFSEALEQQRGSAKSPLAQALLKANGCAEIYMLYDKKRINELQREELVAEKEYPEIIWQRFVERAPAINQNVI